MLTIPSQTINLTFIKRIAVSLLIYLSFFILITHPFVTLASTTNYFYLNPNDPSTLFGISDENGFHYVISDPLGSPNLLLDEQGNVEQQLDYTAFGIERINQINRENNQSSFTSKFSFTGQRKDSESDLLYYGARYYNPEIGRFTQPDPMIIAGNQNDPRFQNALMNPQLLNPYAYTGNNPITNVDPTGEDAVIAINDRWSTITIRSDIYIYGQDATSEVVQRMQTDIMQEWNKWNKGWTYTDPKTNRTYNVAFDVEVGITKHPNIRKSTKFTDKDNNMIQINNERSYVKDEGYIGVWRGNTPDPAPHEFGHLLGLDDHYIEKGGSENGWQGNIMAEKAMQGNVEQRNIDTIIAPYMEKHDQRWFKFINKKTSHHIAPRGTFREQK